MSKRKETIVRRDHLIEIVKEFFFGWFNSSDMFILIMMTMNQDFSWQVYLPEVKCTVHLLLQKYTLLYTCLKKLECTSYTLPTEYTLYLYTLSYIVNYIKILCWFLIPVFHIYTLYIYGTIKYKVCLIYYLSV